MHTRLHVDVGFRICPPGALSSPDGRDVPTIEGLATMDRLHLIQKVSERRLLRPRGRPRMDDSRA